MQTLQPVDLAAARALAPAGARIVPAWPGKALGSVYFASYEPPDSSLAYRELIIVAGIARVARRLCGSIPRLYVDNPDSLAGGRRIWGLPKELAEFTIDRRAAERIVSVRQGGELLCRLRFTDAPFRIPAWVPLPAFGVRDGALASVTGRLSGMAGWTRTLVETPAASPLAALKLAGAWPAVTYDPLHLVVPAPHAVRRAR